MSFNPALASGDLLISSLKMQPMGRFSPEEALAQTE